MINNNNNDNNTFSLVRAVLDQIVTPEDFLEGPLKDWTTDFRGHAVKFKPVLDQISLPRAVNEHNQNEFVNLRPHLDNVMLACSRKLQRNAPDSIDLNFTQEYVEEQLVQPNLHKGSSEYRGGVSQTVLKSMDLIQKYQYGSIATLKNNFFLDGANGLVRG